MDPDQFDTIKLLLGIIVFDLTGIILLLISNGWNEK